MDDSVTKLVDAFLAEADSGLVGTYSAVLYGSAVRGYFTPGQSDINLMLVLDHVSPEALRALGKAYAAWHKAGQPPPLLMSRAEWSRSADAFPIEITDMKSAYRVLRGGDPLAALTVKRGDLRQALETELRGRVMRLRQGSIASGKDPQRLSELMMHSARSTLLLLRTLLKLLGQDVPHDPLAVVMAAAKTANFDPEALAQIVVRREDARWKCEPSLFVKYLAAVEAAARHVDELQTGEL